MKWMFLHFLLIGYAYGTERVPQMLIETLEPSTLTRSLRRGQVQTFDANSPTFGPTVDDLLQTKYDQVKKQLTDTLASSKYISRLFFAREVAATIANCESEPQSSNCITRAVLFGASLAYQQVAIPKYEKWFTDRYNWDLFKKDILQTDATNFWLATPVQPEGLQKAINKLRRVNRISGIASALPTVGFNSEAIYSAGTVIASCIEQSGTINECSSHAIRDSAVEIAFSIADVAATLATIPFVKAGVILDVVLLLAEIGYDFGSTLYRINDAGIHLNNGHIVQIFFEKLIPLYPKDREIPRFERKAKMINEARKQVKLTLDESPAYTGVMFSPGYSTKCNLDLLEKQEVKLSHAQGNSVPNFYNCPAAMDHGITDDCMSWAGIGKSECSLESTHLITVKEYLCEGCGFMKRLGNHQTSEKYVVLLDNMNEKSRIRLPRKKSNDPYVMFNVLHPLTQITDVEMEFPEYSLVTLVFPKSLYFNGNITLGKNSFLLISWQPTSLFSLLQLKEEQKVLSLSSGNHKWFGQDMNKDNLTIQVVGLAERREFLTCSKFDFETKRRININLRGGPTKAKPDSIWNCPFVHVSGHTDFFSTMNQTSVLNLIPPYNRTADSIRIRIESGKVELNLKTSNFFNNPGDVSTQILPSGSTVLKFNIFSTPKLSIEITFANLSSPVLPIEFFDSKSTITMTLYNNSILNFGRIFINNSSCPDFIYSSKLPKVGQIDSSWEKHSILTYVIYNNCTVVMSGTGEEVIHSIGGLIVIYPSGRSKTVIITGTASQNIILKKAFGVGIHQLNIPATQNYTFIEEEFSLIAHNEFLDITIEIENYFDIEFEQKWVIYDDDHKIPLSLGFLENEYHTVPTFYFNSQRLNSYVFTYEARQIWSGLIIDLNKGETLYGKFNNSLVLANKEDTTNKITVIFSDFFDSNKDWNDVYIVFGKDSTESIFIRPSMSIPEFTFKS